MSILKAQSADSTQTAGSAGSPDPTNDSTSTFYKISRLLSLITRFGFRVFAILLFILLIGATIASARAVWVIFAINKYQYRFLPGELLLDFILGLEGLVAYIVFFREEKNEKAKKSRRLFELHKEWNSNAVYMSRRKADKLIRDYPTAKIKELHDEHPDESSDLSIVLGFFQTLQFSTARKLIDERETVELFGQIFIWWYVVGAQSSFPSEWDSHKKLPKLYSLIQEYASDSELKVWENKANEDLKGYQGVRKGGSAE
ncbi:MAG TPA: hypothetical protein VH413_08550 [Verrucomicrobiae bacterium]|jgi:hypothetical protein|nr:hypothetical protein [Verrucomicrobiae bacterium]